MTLLIAMVTAALPGRAAAVVAGIAWSCSAFPASGAPTQQALDSQGNLYFTACDVESSSIAVYKIDPATGQAVWRSVFDGEDGHQSPKALAVDRNGDVFVTASLTRAVGGNDFLTIKYDGKSGGLMWKATFGGAAGGQDVPAALAVDLLGDVYVTGHTSTGQGSAMHTIKYAGGSGALLWSATLAGVSSSTATAIAVDDAGNVAVAGYGNKAGSPFDYGMLTVRYAGHSGAELWRTAQHGGGGNSNGNRATAVAIDHEGNVLATGFLTPAPQQKPDMRTIKYARDGGATLWIASHGGTSNADDKSVAIALNAAGDAFVTGGSQDLGAGTNFYTARYASATGAIVWEVAYNGSANSDDGGHAISVDRIGDVVVTGRSHAGAAKYIARTFKYAGDNGELLWHVADSSGPGNTHDSGGAVSVDFDGNVFVTGQSRDAGGLFTLRTNKYSRNGLLRWLAIASGP